MAKDTAARSRISSFAAPTEEDIAAFAALTESEQRRLVTAELEKGLRGEARRMTADEIMSRVKARLVRG